MTLKRSTVGHFCAKLSKQIVVNKSNKKLTIFTEYCRLNWTSPQLKITCTNNLNKQLYMRLTGRWEQQLSVSYQGRDTAATKSTISVGNSS